MNHGSYFSDSSARKKLSFLISTRQEMEAMEAGQNLASGLPNPDFFPLTEATFTLSDGKVMDISKDLVEVALQYALPDGIPQLLGQLKEMVTELLAPPHMDERMVLVTAGSNAGNYIIAQTFTNPGDYVFLPEVTYPQIHLLYRSANARMVSVAGDHDGMRPDLLREALEKSSDGRRKLLYIIPHGDNPTGITLSEDRMREIYSLACEYDLLIVEDDPYYFLQYDNQVRSSFLSLDTEGRVLRADTFSKTIGAGVRLGYITGDRRFVKELMIHHSLIMSHASPFSQVVISELLKSLGCKGFIEMNKNNAMKYKQLRDMALQAATKHLTGLCEWQKPDGMFLWLKVVGLEDVTEMVLQRCFKRGLFVVPGCKFMIDSTQPSPYIRVSFSVISQDLVDKGFQKLAEIIREELEATPKI